ncbi:tetratricopeptide repeat protein [Actinomyces oris]|uniref:tetratricopeptide repeat protein n=2 Tax=Actinomyces TaxID=1654 RepID=UPI0030B9796E
MHKQSLKDSAHILGPHHPRTLISRNNLANTYRDTGRLDEAITLYERNFEDCIRILGPDHPHTLTSRNNLASAYRAAGRTEEAEVLFETPSGSDDEQDRTEDNPDQETGD